MASLKLEAEQRSEIGKAVKNLDRNQEVPGIIYGNVEEPIAITVNLLAVEKLYLTAGMNHIIEVDIEGGEGSENVKTIFKDVQYNPLTNHIQHFDLYAIDETAKIKTSVPLNFVGEPPAEQGEGIVVTIYETLDIEAPALQLPESLKVDISSLEEIGDVVTLAAIDVPKDVRIIEGDPETVLVKVDPPAEEIVEEEPLMEADLEVPLVGEEAEEGAEEGEAEEGEGESEAEEAKPGETPEETAEPDETS